MASTQSTNISRSINLGVNPVRTFEFSFIQKALQSGRTFPKFTLNGRKCFAGVTSVYDGDTIRLIIDLHDKSDPADIYEFSCRCYGYNSAELRTKDNDEKQRGYAARDYLSELILGKVIRVEFYSEDKYGRALGDLYLIDENQEDFRGASIKDIMIKGGHGAEYYGKGAKRSQ